MEPRSTYKTKQKEILLDYLINRPGEHITAGDVCEHFKSKGSSIGQSTVYRQLERLVDEGVLSKYTIDVNSPACFEYMGKDSHVEKGICFHCKCEKCGKLIHLHCDEMEAIKNHMLEHHGFTMDPMRTVFYGLCEDCSKEQEDSDK